MGTSTEFGGIFGPITLQVHHRETGSQEMRRKKRQFYVSP